MRSLQSDHLLRCLRLLAAMTCLASAMAGCAPSWPRADWSGSPYLSKSEVLRFLAPADCTVPWPFNPVTSDYFYEVERFQPEPGERWLFKVQYRDAAMIVSRTVYVTQRWTAAKTYDYPLPNYDAHRSCVVLVEVPQSVSAHRPYFVEDASKKENEYREAQELQRAVMWILCPAFILLLIPSWFGFACWFGFEARAGAWWIAAGAATLIVSANFLACQVFVEWPWQVFQGALAYEKWFEALPRATGELLPISREDFAYLLAGPPAPASTEIWILPVLAITAVLCGAWLGGVLRAARDGVYWWLAPLPLEQVHERALAEGRAPTVEELDTALFRALAGKHEWQINVMRRKAERFARRLRQFIAVTAPPRR